MSLRRSVLNTKPKIALINGSPRKYGSSYKLLYVASRGVVDAGGEYVWIDLYDYRIKECFGCVSDDQSVCRYPCIIDDDDFNKLAKNILETHGFIISTPVYWYSVPGLLKNFIDRLTSFENMIFHKGRSLLEGKVSGFIAVGADSGCITTISHLMVVFNSMGVHIPPWALAYSYKGDDALEDEQAVRDSYNVGYIVARAASILANNEWYNPNVNVEKLVKETENTVVKLYNNKLDRLEIYKNKLKTII
ncbi:MAG: NAD(P)H-dependent oxidoreductase [Desulfurococcaceae archaeon]